mmetsp:Transcript_15025/g.42167  ORF Transcript_15025/g.42167 Transcript_15025/m.42167 type:complete len:221 (-) Transcript_15025:817-1479(-)
MAARKVDTSAICSAGKPTLNKAPDLSSSDMAARSAIVRIFFRLSFLIMSTSIKGSCSRTAAASPPLSAFAVPVWAGLRTRMGTAWVRHCIISTTAMAGHIHPYRKYCLRGYTATFISSARREGRRCSMNLRSGFRISGISSSARSRKASSNMCTLTMEDLRFQKSFLTSFRSGWKRVTSFFSSSNANAWSEGTGMSMNSFATTSVSGMRRRPCDSLMPNL